LYFHGVITEHDFEKIEREFKAAQLRSAVCFAFENPLNATILRIMAGPEHYKVAYDLYTEIVYKTASIPGDGRHWISAVEATRFRVSGVRSMDSMEGDQGLRPITRVERESWPSLMIEVGCLETQDLLPLDAEWQLLNLVG